MPFIWVGESGRPSLPSPVDHFTAVEPLHAGTAVRTLGEPEAASRRSVQILKALKRYTGHEGEERRPAVEAGQIMKAPVVTVTPDTSVDAAREIFRRRRFRHLPVIDAEGRLVGLVSDRYLEEAVIPPQVVGDVMATRVLTATSGTEIREIARMMAEHQLGCLPILDDRGRPVGVVTTTDVLHCIIATAPLDLWV